MIGGRSHRPQSFFYTASIHVYIYLNVYRHRYLLLCDIYRASKKEVRLVHSTFHDGIFFAARRGATTMPQCRARWQMTRALQFRATFNHTTYIIDEIYCENSWINVNLLAEYIGKIKTLLYKQKNFKLVFKLFFTHW